MDARHLRLHETEVLIHKRDMPAGNVAARELARGAFEKPGAASPAAAEVQNVAVFGKRPRTGFAHCCKEIGPMFGEVAHILQTADVVHEINRRKYAGVLSKLRPFKDSGAIEPEPLLDWHPAPQPIVDSVTIHGW